ncbi:MAG: phage/plasmid primase, P4 family [Terracidiphilus sp.]|nr:phage/plasmid primase, P4 family [Terracidiphilus sp.]MDR3798343.1 phage/plasmid primase, P4 family [Terracidiphilus sp.]
MSTLPAVIIDAAGRGWRMFPVKTRGKLPLIAEWPARASSDPAVLEAWAQEYPGCNWGVATGQPSAVFVVDVDGEAGRASVAELERQGLTFPATLTVTTGRADGGEHRYFRMPSGVDVHNDQSGRIGSHIDVRGTGGFVVCPPSVHASGKEYRFIDPDTPIADAPAWVIERLTARLPMPTATAQVSQDAVTKGGRTNRLVSLAGTLHKRGMAVEAIEAALIAENVAKCSPPLPETKVRSIARDIPQRYPNPGAGTPAATSSPESDGKPAEYADDALALRFTERHRDDLRFTAAWGHWRVWDGRVWKQDETLKVFDLARAVCREQSAGCEEKRLASRIASAMTVAAVERLARADRRHAAVIDQWDADPWLLNTAGGVVDLRTGTIRPANREDYMTKITAVAPGGKCPLWLSFLARITDGNEELQGYLQRMVGYTTTGVTVEHALFFLYGIGANGKSVFLNTIAGLMGDYARTAPIEAFIDSKSERHPTDLAGLQGARLVTAVETEDGRRWAESKLKALTGGDRIAARYMRQDFFQFTPQFKLLVAGNHKPGLRTVDEAIRRRFNLLPFTVTIPPSERDVELTEKLREEWGGILLWAIEGCLAWQSEGLLAPKAVTEATASYLAAEDALARWIEDCTEKKDGAWESASALFSSWKTWADTAGEFGGSQKRFSENLTARGFAQVRTKVARGFGGIRLRKNVVADDGKSAPSNKNKLPEDTEVEGRFEV